MKPLSQAKIALVYDRVNTPFGGAENVLVALHEIWPAAPLFTSVYDAQKAPWAHNFTVTPSFLQKIPFAKNFHRSFAFAMPLAFESFDFSQFDVIISVTSAEAKGVLTKPNQLHLCYLLTPTRYLWSHADEYQQHWLTGWLRRWLFHYLRWWDEAAAFRPDIYIPISEIVADRCRQYYHREPAKVIYPTVSLPMNAKAAASVVPENLPENYYLIVSRLVPYKKIDLAIRACQQTSRNLVIIGEGPDLKRLQNVAKEERMPPSPESAPPSPSMPSLAHASSITFLHSLSAQKVHEYYQNCRAFLAPAEEDFGMTVVEAQQAGKPVIIYAQSGGAELVIEGETGIHFTHHTVDGLAEAMYILESRQWDSAAIRKSAVQYTTAVFQRQFLKAVEKNWADFQVAFQNQKEPYVTK